MAFFLYTIHVVTCLFLILVVLLQQGKGADLSVFGGGGTMTAFGARGAASLLHKLTVGGFILFTLTTLAIGAFQKQGRSVVTDIPAAEAKVEEAAPVAAEGEATAEPVSGALPEAEDPAITSPEAEEWEETDAEPPPEGSEPPPESGESGN